MRKQKEKMIRRTFSMRQSESDLIDRVGEERKFDNSSLALRQILHEWKDEVRDGKQLVQNVS